MLRLGLITQLRRQCLALGGHLCGHQNTAYSVQLIGLVMVGDTRLMEKNGFLKMA